MRKTTTLPKGWEEAKVRRVLKHYEEQSDAAAAAEDDAAFKRPTQTAIGVPVALVAKVRRLIAQHRAPNKRLQPTRKKSARG